MSCSSSISIAKKKILYFLISFTISFSSSASYKITYGRQCHLKQVLWQVPLIRKLHPPGQIKRPRFHLLVRLPTLLAPKRRRLLQILRHGATMHQMVDLQLGCAFSELGVHRSAALAGSTVRTRQADYAFSILTKSYQALVHSRNITKLIS
jgi:hypothetical protein